MHQWEYMTLLAFQSGSAFAPVLVIQENGETVQSQRPHLQEHLNALGVEGWEVGGAGAASEGGYLLIILKRRMS